MQPKTTLEDVAAKAGVHRTTVSLALRDHPRIPRDTRDRVKAIAAKLGYRVNPLVSALMQSRRMGRSVKHVTLAYVTTHPTRYGWRPEGGHDRPNFFPGAVDRAADFGYKLEHLWLAEPGMTPERFCDILSVRGINGIIVGRLPPGMTSLTLDWERFSCVALGMTLRCPQLHHVTENHFDTVWQAMQQCHERGYRRVGLVWGDANDSPRVADRWLSAYLGQQRLFAPADRLEPCLESPLGVDAFAAWYRREKPDAILTIRASSIVGALKSLGVEVPRDVGLVELEDRPHLGNSGMYYDPAKVGALAVEILVGLLHRNDTGVPSDPHEVLLSGVWREGQTLPFRTA